MTATILAIDTCEKTCAAAIVSGGETLAQRMEEIGRGHAERLLPMIDELLAEAGVGFDALTRIAVCTGPGTFTGLRIGLSVARGLALSLGIPCVGIMSLPVLAAQGAVSLNLPAGSYVHSIVMGRGGQGFHQAFQIDQTGQVAALTAPSSQDGEKIKRTVETYPGLVVGSGAELISQASAVVAVDPVSLAQVCEHLDPKGFPPEPAYLRAADAAKGKRTLPIEGRLSVHD